MKVAIVGRAPSSRYMAPFNDKDWSIWTLSPAHEGEICDLPRYDRWYELHDLDLKESHHSGYIDWMSSLECELIIGRHDDRLPNALEYDLDGTLAEFGRYFNNSISFMIADAIREGAETIGLYGVDMAHHTEYGDQRPSCEYMVGVAKGRGIQVIVPKQSDLLKTRYLYGFEDEGDFEFKLKTRKEELQGRLLSHEASLAEVHQKITATCGAIGELQQLRELLKAAEVEADPKLFESMDTREQAMMQSVESMKSQRSQVEKTKYIIQGAIEELEYEREWI